MRLAGAVPTEQAFDGFRKTRQRAFRYRREADLARKTALALGFAGLTGLAAQIRLPLGFTPVPVTLQTAAVLLAGIALGARWGGLSQGLYAGLGAVGVPWFAGTTAGLGTILGPTGGYVVGFVLAAAVIGSLTDRFVSVRRAPVLLAVLAVVNFGVIYGVGLPWLYAWLAVLQGSAPSVADLLTMGLLPFVLGDLLKVLGVAALGSAITPSIAVARSCPAE